MKLFKSILLLFIIGITFFPWQLICLHHPLGHEHHEHTGPSSCELYKMALQEPGEHLLPPMECKHTSFVSDTYNDSLNEGKILPYVQWVAVLAVMFDMVHIEVFEPPFLTPPRPYCRSAPLLSDSPLRAPPLA